MDPLLCDCCECGAFSTVLDKIRDLEADIGSLQARVESALEKLGVEED